MSDRASLNAAQVSFQNPGLIDPRCISTIGVSVKEGENPIGFFGTGLKYAIAIILRGGGRISIWRGMDELHFDTATASIRGKDFSVVRMNGIELGFTADLGKHWEVWQAFRELHCNAKDEGGITKAGKIDPAEGTTVVHVEMPEMLACYYDRAKYLLETSPIMDGPHAAFHPGPSAGIFYRTVFVGRISPKPHLYTPNIIEQITLTEDRTIADTWSVGGAIARAILRCEDAEFLERFLTAPGDYAESELDLDWPYEPSDAFMRTVRKLLPDRSRPCNASAKKVYEKRQPAPELVEATLLPYEEKALRKAITFCHALRFPVDEFPIVLVESLGENIFGMANLRRRHITLARRAIQMGDTFLASTLIEEWAHIKHGYRDCSREMQNWLFEQMVTFGAAYLDERERVTA